MVLVLCGNFVSAQDTAGAQGGQAAEAENPLRDASVLEPVLNLSRVLNQLTENYRRELRSAKQTAVANADPDEVQLINDALAGKPVSVFSSVSARTARLNYDRGLVIAADNFAQALNAGVVALLRKEKVAPAKQLKTLAEYIAYNSDAVKESLKTYNVILKPDGNDTKPAADNAKTVNRQISIEADKDWQNTQLTLPPGTTVEVQATGRWAPGTLNKDDDKYKSGDADTYNVELRISGGKEVFCGGTKWSFKSGAGGELSGRMKEYNAAGRANARGSMTLSLRWQELKPEAARKPVAQAVEPLEFILAKQLPDGGEKLFGSNLNAPAGSAKAGNGQTATGAKAAAGANDPKGKQGNDTAKPAEAAGKDATAAGQAKLYKKFYRFKVYANKDWQIYPIEIKPNDKITLSASGKWTPDTQKKEMGGAEVYAYNYKIGGGEAGSAGAKAEFTATVGGKLLCRIDSRDWIVSSGAQPAGELEITVTIEREGEEIK